MLRKEFLPLLDLMPRSAKLFRSLNESCSETFDNVKTQYVLIFDYSYQGREVYIKNFKEDFFTECVSSGYSSMGKTKTLSIQNVWEPNYIRDQKIFINDNRMMLARGMENNFFEFLGEIKVDKELKIMTLETSEFPLKDLFEQLLTLNYLKLPQNMMHISYAYKSAGLNPIYFLIYHPAYNFSYETFNIIVIEDLNTNLFKRLTPIDVQRYRDGGTTFIKCKENDKQFYFPTPFNKELNATYEGMKIVEVDDVEYSAFVKLLERNSFEVENKERKI